MGSAGDRPPPTKKRDLLWKKAILHFSLCFVMGFFTGFAPSSSDSIFSAPTNPYHESIKLEDDPVPNATFFAESLFTAPIDLNATGPAPSSDDSDEVGDFRKQLILITTTRTGDPFKEPSLRRLSHTLRLVPPPLLWIVVESRAEAPATAGMLRMTGVMYRHLAVGENFTDAGEEAEHQRNVALNHVEQHRLDGIVHFAELSNFYDLHFFDDIREIEAFGAWPVASMSANRKRVTVEGPVCRSSQVLGWHLKGRNNSVNDHNGLSDKRAPRIGVSGFAFNSSILWDPERWGRSSSLSDSSQDSIKFVQQVVVEGESKLMAFPPDCSRVMLWRVHVPRSLFLGNPMQQMSVDLNQN